MSPTKYLLHYEKKYFFGSINEQQFLCKVNHFPKFSCLFLCSHTFNYHKCLFNPPSVISIYKNSVTEYSRTTDAFHKSKYISINYEEIYKSISFSHKYLFSSF